MFTVAGLVRAALFDNTDNERVAVFYRIYLLLQVGSDDDENDDETSCGGANKNNLLRFLSCGIWSQEFLGIWHQHPIRPVDQVEEGKGLRNQIFS